MGVISVNLELNKEIFENQMFVDWIFIRRSMKLSVGKMVKQGNKPDVEDIQSLQA